MGLHWYGHWQYTINVIIYELVGVGWSTYRDRSSDVNNENHVCIFGYPLLKNKYDRGISLDVPSTQPSRLNDIDLTRTGFIKFRNQCVVTLAAIKYCIFDKLYIINQNQFVTDEE